MSRLNHVKSLGHKLDAFTSKRRLLIGLAIPTFQAIGADLVAQSCNKSNGINHYYGFNPYQSNSALNFIHSIDWNRTAVFATFGFCYLGAFQYVLYVKFINKTFERIINPQHIMLDRTAKIFFDQCIHTPFFYFPAFYFIKDRLQNDESKSAENKESEMYRLPSMNDLSSAWKIWVPAQCVTFAMNRHWRLPWISSISFIWTVILSMSTMN